MNKTTIQTISEQQELNRKLYNKENPNKKIMNKTTEQLLTELIEIHAKHIETLNERIEVLQQTIQIDKITIKTQEKTIKLYIDNLNSNTYV